MGGVASGEKCDLSGKSSQVPRMASSDSTAVSGFITCGLGRCLRRFRCVRDLLGIRRFLRGRIPIAGGSILLNRILVGIRLLRRVGLRITPHCNQRRHYCQTKPSHRKYSRRSPCTQEALHWHRRGQDEHGCSYRRFVGDDALVTGVYQDQSPSDRFCKLTPQPQGQLIREKNPLSNLNPVDIMSD